MKWIRRAWDGEGSTRRLFTVYAAVMLVPVLALGAVLLLVNQHSARNEGLARGRAEASLVSSTVISPLLDGHDLATGLRPVESAAVSRSVDAAVDDGRILRLRIRDQEGRIVWADDGSTDNGAVDDEALEAATGRTVTHITSLNADADADEAPAAGAADAGADADINPGPRVVESYTPILAPGTGRQIGVLEVYLPYAPIAADIDRGERAMGFALTGGLIFLWAALLGVTVSVTRRLRRSAAASTYLADHDTLTALPNRTKFADLAVAAIASATHERPAAVAVIDLDRFKQINDTLGHENGDTLLVQLAERLKASIRDGDAVARLGGDEFGVVLGEVHGPSEAIEILQRLRAAIAAPLSVDGLPLAVEASIGFVLAPLDGADVDPLLTHADVAMYVAKRQHLGVVHYQANQNQYDAQTLALVAELGAGIAGGQLVLHYQPKTDLRTRRVSAVEALVRWNHPTRGLLFPDSFLPAVEQTELVDPLTTWVLREALRTVPLIDPTGVLAVAVNVSARSLSRPDFTDDVLAVLVETGMDPARVIIEVTETALIDDPMRAAATLNRLSGAGLRISVDDFGAGQTSLGYLATLPITELKIDKAFVLAMTADGRNAAIVRSVIELGHSLGFTVTAEGVETQAALDRLIAADCDLVQGYFLARPTDAGHLARAIETIARRLDPVSAGG